MEETKNVLSRRHFLTKGSAAVGALGLAVSSGSLLVPSQANAAYAALTFPKPAALDVEAVRKYAYYWYKKGPGCGHGSARGLLQAFAEASEAQFGVGNAGGWDQIPRNLYAWCNGGGPSSWGALCGSIAGAVGVMQLVGAPAALQSAIFEWYVKQNFPLDNVANLSGLALGADYGGGALAQNQVPIPNDLVKGHAVPDSPLCHVSVSKWLAAAGVQYGQSDATGLYAGNEYRGDRCAKVTGDTAAYAASLYNTWSNGGSFNGSIAGWQKPSAMASCFDCHDSSGPVGVTNKTSGTKMDCLPCHTEPVSGRK